MKKQFLISNEEKNRILGLHESMKPKHGTSMLNEEKYRKGDTINLIVDDTKDNVNLKITKRYSKDMYEGKIQNDSIKIQGKVYKTKNAVGTVSLKQKHLCIKFDTQNPCIDVTIKGKVNKQNDLIDTQYIPTTQTVSGREEM